MATKDQGLKVLASKGVHITVPRDRIKATSGIFTKTEKSVLFIIPWQRYWIIGTTDTPTPRTVSALSPPRLTFATCSIRPTS